MAAAASTAVRVPANLSGAISTRTALPSHEEGMAMVEQHRSWGRVVGAAVGAAALVAVAAVAVASSSPEASPPVPASSAEATAEVSQPAVPTDEAVEDDASGDGEAGASAEAREKAAKGEPGERGERARDGRPDEAGPPAWAGARGRESRDEAVTCQSARNHGEYVSSVARSTPGGPDKDAVMTEAAESDCPPGFRDRPDDEADAEE
jgi:hypothetical protein